MVLSTDPELILLDEPAAGMTHEEVYKHRRTGARDQPHQGADRGRARHAVHPHDRQEGDGLQSGQRAGRGQRREIMRDPQVRDIYLGKQAAGMMLDVRLRRLWPHPDPQRRQLRRRRGRVRRHSRPQRHGQDDAAEGADGLSAGDRRARAFDGDDITALPSPIGARGSASAMCRRAARFSRRSPSTTICAWAAASRRRRGRRSSRPCWTNFPRLNCCSTRRRRALRRRAAAAGDRALPVRQAAAHAARRADRRHPALDHRGDRRDACSGCAPAAGSP